jgi:2-C-methyl-D-erythritol 4-phosphate cytidylyltransferase
VVAILVAGGRGRRMGEERPKQFLPLAGTSLLLRAADALRGSDEVDGIVVVAPEDELETVQSVVKPVSGILSVVAGGEIRRASVAAGLEAVPPSAGIIVVHDAARPLASPFLVSQVVAVARRTGAAIPGLPLTDTIKRVDQVTHQVQGTVPREELVAVQTPQAFRADWLRKAHAEAGQGAYAPDDAALVEALGLPVEVVPGEEDNLKVTRIGDLEMAELLLSRREGEE